MNLKSIAFIPARSGSKRVPNKNVKPFGGHPLIAYTIRTAIESGVFDAVVCATDSQYYADIAIHYGAEVPLLRPKEISDDKSSDIDWVLWILDQLQSLGRSYSYFSILRPTSPFRSISTIQRAWGIFTKDSGAHSLRAVEKCTQHPGKMWVLRGNRMLPIMPFEIETTPWHSSQYASLPVVYAQNASLEIARTSIVYEKKSISGDVVIPFISTGYEGYDINNELDWLLGELLIDKNKISLPTISVNPFPQLLNE